MLIRIIAGSQFTTKQYENDRKKTDIMVSRIFSSVDIMNMLVS